MRPRQVQPMPPSPAVGSGRPGKYDRAEPTEQYGCHTLRHPNPPAAVGLTHVMEQRGKEYIVVAAAGANQPIVYCQQMGSVGRRKACHQLPLARRQERPEPRVDGPVIPGPEVARELPDAQAHASASRA